MKYGSRIWPALFRADRVASLAATAAICTVFIGLDGQLGPLSFTLRRAISLVLLTFVVALFALGSQEKRRILVWANVVVSLALVAWAPSVFLTLVGFVLVLSVAQTASVSRAAGLFVKDGVVHACICYIGLGFIANLVPQVNSSSVYVSEIASRYLARIGGSLVRPSLTALGWPPVLLAMLYLLCRWRLVGGIVRPILAIILPLAWFAGLVALIPDAKASPLATFGRGAGYGVTLLVLVTLLDNVVQGSSRPCAEPISSSVGWPAASFAFLAAMFAGVCLVGISLLGPIAGKTILVHNRGGLDWDRPVFGKFGAFSGGMFGLLPVYCRAEGYKFDIIDKDKIETADLAKTQILVLINSPKVWNESERRTVLDFVARGGNLLILGDHTDVFGLMRGFNGLLDAFGIQFQFDSAYKAKETWEGCQAAGPDAVAWRWDQENPSVAVGSSLELHGWARPLLVGRYGFSDAGVRENYVGSFLGNYHYDRGEKLGDVVLVATAAYGKGRVVVWGDTTAFQGNLSRSYARVVGPLLSWMSRPSALTERPWVRATAAAGLVAAIIWLWVVRANSQRASVVALGLFVGLAVPWTLGQSNLDLPIHIGRDVVLVDQSHSPASGHYEAKVNPVGPLYTNLLRSGFRVMDMKTWDSKSIARARGIAFIAPQRPIPPSEVADLMRAEKEGTVILLSVGHPDSAGSRHLLAAHGLELVPRPLGTLMSTSPSASRREREQVPRFLDAWPIATIDEGDPASLPGVEVIYRHEGDVVALFRRVGRGGLLLFADTRFFSDMNIEDVSSFWPGNLALIHDVFSRYLGADPDAVRPLFLSPEKPE